MIEIVAYRDCWPEEFGAIGARMRSALGPLAVAIHHIGSTAVPGMPAKDIIDVQITVTRLDDPIADGLLELGFADAGIFEDHMPWGMELDQRDMQKRYFRAAREARTHLHVRSVDRFNSRYPLICRDYLRTHPIAAAAYAEIKRQLAKRFPDDPDSYYDIKDPVFDVIMSGGLAWADATGWRVPPTDA